MSDLGKNILYGTEDYPITEATLLIRSFGRGYDKAEDWHRSVIHQINPSGIVLLTGRGDKSHIGLVESFPKSSVYTVADYDQVDFHVIPDALRLSQDLNPGKPAIFISPGTAVEPMHFDSVLGAMNAGYSVAGTPVVNQGNFGQSPGHFNWNVFTAYSPDAANIIAQMPADWIELMVTGTMGSITLNPPLSDGSTIPLGGAEEPLMNGWLLQYLNYDPLVRFMLDLSTPIGNISMLDGTNVSFRDKLLRKLFNLVGYAIHMEWLSPSARFTLIDYIKRYDLPKDETEYNECLAQMASYRALRQAM